ncbi:MAG: zinc ribbon domain-containing protein [Desulfobulbaceae bacterium]|nr:zinc ribbon domain-containing protein [Desulfobulbaceae bacterium]
MPLYDFICRDCGKECELLIMGSDTPACPHCASENLSKQMSTFAFRSGSSKSGGEQSSGGSASKCSGCAGGTCATCH